ncbi:hypothetical protein [Paludisphaera sp.]|uniref:hypothetical protein n=1 Tax=Paludisphaera sp. TaxID=2017432 RepID=UPI00301D5D13
MARTGMVRLTSVLLVMALIEGRSDGALIRYEFSSPLLADAGPPAWWESVRDASGPLVDPRGEFPGWRVVDPTPASEQGLPAPRGPVQPAWAFEEGLGIASFLMAAADVAAPLPEEDDGTATEPPLALAAIMGVAAWRLCRRRDRARSMRPVRAQPAPARATGTAMVLASRPAPTACLPAPRPRRFDARAVAARPLMLPARFVEVSATSLPARRMGATAVSVRRRNSVRRVPA